MSDYQIVGLTANHNIALQFDNKIVNFPLPILDGLYPVGADLTQLLDNYVANARAAAIAQTIPVSNAADIQSLVVPATVTAPTTNLSFRKNQLLAITDHTQLADSGLTSDQVAGWAIYRAALRALSQQSGFPNAVIWPIPPIPVKNANGIVLTAADGSPI